MLKEQCSIFMNPILSIVIPVYNVEQYVKDCLDSCFRQNVPLYKYEIIIINDGSRDNSLDVVNKTIQGRSNIIVYSQLNSGLSAARNKGLSLSRGKYVWFVDSDDWIIDNCLDEIINYLELSPDILLITSQHLYNKPRFPIGQRMKGVDVLSQSGFRVCVPYSIFNINFLRNNNLEMLQGVFHEDLEFTPRVYYYASLVVCVDKPFYHLRTRIGSITQTFNPKRAFDSLIVADSLSRFANSLNTNERSIISKYVSIAVIESLRTYNCMNLNDRKIFEEELRKKRMIFRTMMVCKDKRFRCVGALFWFMGTFAISNTKYFKVFREEFTS